jgi:ABC-type iron transport system FetAB ATPase subunit
MDALFSVSGLRFLKLGPFNFQLAAGECIALKGASGSGKTRLLRALADLDDNQGEVLLEGQRREDIEPREWRSRVAFVPADTAWWNETVGAHFSHAPQSSMLSALGFDSTIMQWRISRVSSGERQRLGLLRALTVQPRILLLDEPTANLDPDNSLAVEALVADYQQQNRAGVVWVSHDKPQRGRIAQRSFEIHKGQLKEER